MALKNRVKKARAAARFVGVVKRDGRGRPTMTITPGTGGKRYQQIIRRRKKTTVTIECRLDTSRGYAICPGNNRTVCYHGIAAITYSAEDVGFKISWCKNEQDAQRVANLVGGYSLKVCPDQNKGAVWAVVYK